MRPFGKKRVVFGRQYGFPSFLCRGSWRGPLALLVAALALSAGVLLGGGLQAAAQAQAQAEETTGGVCGRAGKVGDALVAASPAAACADVTDLYLRDITSLDLSGQGITSLSAGDFNGLHRLDTLDLSGNSLAALPSGIFDELYLLTTLQLHDNDLTSLPADSFAQLFLLKELTLGDNELTSLPDGLGVDFTHFDAFQADGTQAKDTGDYPRITRFVNRHSITGVEEFIAALPELHKERFVLMYKSKSPARNHVSSERPRVISWGADGQFIFAWNTDPNAPEMFRKSVEFLRQDEHKWAVGVIDFSGETPEITEPASCQACHGSVGKPLWNDWLFWEGTEYIASTGYEYDPDATESMRRIVNSSEPRIEPLDFGASTFVGGYGLRALNLPGQIPYAAVVEEAGAVWSWRHTEILFRLLKERREDFPQLGETVMCAPDGPGAHTMPVLETFHPRDHHLHFFANAELSLTRYGMIRGVNPNSRAAGYFYQYPGSIPRAVTFLLLVDLWEREEMVRHLYRNTRNQDTLPSGTYDASTLLHFPSGTATAEDELIQKLRIHFGRGGRPALEARGRQNGRLHMGGILSSRFWEEHGDVMRLRVCSALRESQPSGLEASVSEADVALSWETPTYDPDALTGYRILRGAADSDLAVHVADTGSTDTSYTDESLGNGSYTYRVRAIYDDYYQGPESLAAQITVGPRPQAVGNLVTARGSGRVTLTWTAPSGEPAPDGYRVYRGTTASDLSLLASLTGGATASHIDATALDHRVYHYAVAARTGDALGPGSTPVKAADAAPRIPRYIDKHLAIGENATAVATLAATDEDTRTADLTWSIPSGTDGGADGGKFSITSVGVLTFAAAKDFENPDDADTDGVYDVAVRVSDGARTDKADLTVTLANVNETPTADAGADQGDVVQGALVTLAGSGTDPDAGEVLSYEWTQTGTPAVTLSDASAATTTFTAPTGMTEAATLTFTLRVTDDEGLYHEDTVSVTVAGSLMVAEGTTAVTTLTAADADLSGGELTWSIPSGTDGGADGGKFSITSVGVLTFAAAKDFENPDDANGDGTYQMGVRVSDGTETAELSLTVTLANVNEAPAAEAGEDRTGIAQGTTVTLAGSGTDPDAGEVLSYGWTQTGTPAVTLSDAAAASPTFAAPTGMTEAATLTFTLRVTDDEGLYHEDTVSVTVAAPESDPLTAQFEQMPPQHDGSADLTFRLRFSEEIAISYQDFTGSVFQVSGGTVRKASRLAPPSSIGWEIVARPGGDGAVDITLPGNRACDVAGAICTAEGKQLSATISASVSGPDDEETATEEETNSDPLTAQFERMPPQHDGSADLTFRLRFSEEIAISYQDFTGSVFQVAGGTVRKASRLAPPSSIGWEIVARPGGDGAVDITLPGNRACDVTGAICTAEGKQLSATISASVSGPDDQRLRRRRFRPVDGSVRACRLSTGSADLTFRLRFWRLQLPGLHGFGFPPR